MGTLMPEYLRVVNKTGETLKIIQPITFSCSMSLSYDKNALSFSMPLDEELLELNTIIVYSTKWSETFGGRITIIDIDEENRVVNYTGDSWTGMLNDYVVEIGSSDSTIRLYNNEDYPGDQNDLSSAHYPKNGLYPYLHYVFGVFELEFGAEPGDIVEVEEGHASETFKVKLGSTLADMLKTFTESTELIPIITYKGEFGELLSFKFEEPIHHGQVIDTVFDLCAPYSSKSIYTKAVALTATFDGVHMHYLASDGEYKTRQNIYYNGMPDDLKYKGIDMITKWDSNDNSFSTNRKALKYERESALLSKVSSEITQPFGYSLGLDLARIGDYVTLRMSESKELIEQKIIKKTLNLINGTPFVTVSFG